MVKVVILAIGAEPSKDLQREIPRCLIEIGGEAILQRQIDILKSAGVEEKDISVVIGGKGKAWNEDNQERVRKIHPNVIINNHNLETHNSYSFWLAVKETREDVLCIDGDLLLSKEVIKSVINHSSPSLVLMKRMRHLLGGNKLSVKSNRVVGVSTYSEPEVIYMGLAKFGKDLLEELKKELNVIEHFNSSLAIPLDKICARHYIHGLDIEEVLEEASATRVSAEGNR